MRGQEWALSQTGNWGGFKLDSNGDGDHTDTASPADRNQTRAHNAANEISAVAEDSGQPAWPDPAQDARGNMTSFPKPFDPASSFSAVYDAWNRMVEVKSGQTTVGRYSYDGLNRRIRCDSDSQSRPGGVDTYQHCYFNTGWQMLETRRTGTSGDSPESIQPECQYVWSVRYVAAMVLRDKNTDDAWKEQL